MIAAIALLAAPAPAPDFALLRAADLRLATIGHRLAVANRALCRDLAPRPGWAIHAIDQYAPATRDAARAVFGFPSPVSVEAVVPGGAAARAGLAAGDGVLAIADAPVPSAGAGTSSATRDRALAMIAAQPAAVPLRLTIRRGDRTFAVTLPAAPGCRVAFDLADEDEEAFSDGGSVRIGAGYMARWDDAAIAVLVAHELGHVILRHRARLTAAGVTVGAAAEFGRGRRLNRLAEDEADRLTPHLLRNAGYDPAIAVRFWREEGPKADGGIFRSRVYRSAADRAARIAAEIAAMPAGAPIPYAPPALLAARDAAMD